MTFRTVERLSRNDWDCFAGAERFNNGTDLNKALKKIEQMKGERE